MRRALLALISLLITACQSIGGDIPRAGSIVPDARLRITPGYSMALEDVVLIGGISYLAYKLIDPQAPAWDIRETHLGPERVLFSLSMKPIHAGGAGEARQVLLRRANALAAERGYRSYEIRRFEESIESRVWLTQRKAEAEIALLHPLR